MAKLTKTQAREHLAALALLSKPSLSLDERWEVLEKYREDAEHPNALDGAFFTPLGLARDFGIEVPACRRLIDLCAGIGTLAYMHSRAYRAWGTGPFPEIVCVERNPAYVAVGRKLIPEATWIEADVFDLPKLGLGHFDVAISNPPFGAVRRSGRAPRHGGPEFEYAVIDLASDVADLGVFIVPQASAPFEFSGSRSYRETPDERHDRFRDATGIVLEAGCGIDCDHYRSEWRGVAPAVEIVLADFVEARLRRLPVQRSFFEGEPALSRPLASGAAR